MCKQGVTDPIHRHVRRARRVAARAGIATAQDAQSAPILEILNRHIEAEEAVLVDLRARQRTLFSQGGTRRPVVLYRDQGSPSEDEAERAAITATFGAPIRSRLDVRPGDLVIGRYSVLPFYRELEAEVTSLGGRLLNTASQHEYIADIQNWYGDLFDLTPKTWFRLEDIEGDGPFVLKGGTNSRKQDWATHMFAATRADASRVYSRLASDGLIGRQQIVIREYVPLVTYGHLLNDLPVTNEFRFLVAAGRVIGAPFYWSSFVEDIAPVVAPTKPTPAMEWVVSETIKRIGDKACAYTVDVAEDRPGAAVLIELNDLQMAGLSGYDPALFYAKLLGALIESGAAHSLDDAYMNPKGA
jgi:hypothetical protein